MFKLAKGLRPAGKAPAPRLRAGNLRFPWMALLLIAVLLAALAEAAFIVQATTGWGCDSCHVPRRAIAQQAGKPHAEVACLDCHLSPGGASLLELNARAARNLLAQVTPGDSSAVGGVGRAGDGVLSSRCEGCHSDALTEPLTTAEGLKMSHREPLAAGVACLSCHRRETHGARAALPERDHGSCSSCHDGKTAAISCETCHDADPPREPQKLPAREARLHADGARLHGMGQLDSCPICHTRTFCKSCHGVDLPHEMNEFPFLHGEQAKSAEEACLSCHRQSFCDSCHQIPMPHPESYLRVHQAETEQRGEAVCRRCHVAEDCTYCHESHIHPGLPDRLLDELRGS